MKNQELFDDVREFSNDQAKIRFESLVGIDDIRTQLVKMASLWLDPNILKQWSKKHYKQQLPIVERFQNLPHLVVLAGDVGTGKTTLAETFGDAVARELKIPLTLYRLSMTSRGKGAVGEMTQKLSSAFGEIKSLAKNHVSKGDSSNAGIILLIDEADAIVQSRELDQMHHEDRAGVNTVIRGIDDLSNLNFPVLIVLCTNRLSAIDPAVKRRASKIFTFTRPNNEQRRAALKLGLEGLGFDDSELEQLVNATGPKNGKDYGFTYSDLFQQLLPSLIVFFAPENKIEFSDALIIANEMRPTPPFTEYHQ